MGLEELWFVCWLVCLTSQLHVSVSQGTDLLRQGLRVTTTETKVADRTFYLAQSQYTDTRPTSPSADPITTGAWQGSTGVPISKSLI